MNRPGRPRKPDAKRHQTTRAGRHGDNGEPTVELLIRRIEAAGLCVVRPAQYDDPVYGGAVRAEHRERVKTMASEMGLASASADHPLDLLRAAGTLSTMQEAEFDLDRCAELAEQRYKAGCVFAYLHWRRYGRPFAKIPDSGYRTAAAAQERSSKEWEELTEDQQEEWRKRTYDRMRKALERRGRHVEAVTIAALVHCQRPRASQIAALRRGLDGLTRIERVRYEDLPAAEPLVASVAAVA